MKVLAIILAGGKRQELSLLVNRRSKAAVPFFGKYRVIDFVLSNCVNSNIRKINVVVQHRFASLQRHIRDAWSIYSTTLGEYIDVYPPQQRMGERFYLGTADSVYQNLFTIEDESPDYILTLSGDHIYKMDYSKLIDFHIEKGANLTIATSEVSVREAKSFGVVEYTKDHKITSFREKPLDLYNGGGSDERCRVSMGLYVFSTEILKEIFYTSVKDNKSVQDFGQHIIPDMVKKGEVYAYPFFRGDGSPCYWNVLDSVEKYYAGNMTILNKGCEIDLYDLSWPYRAYQSQSAPTRTYIESRGTIINSSISGGGEIGGSLKNSILGTHVRVAEGAQVEDSILFDNVIVGKGAVIKKAIIEKDIEIGEAKELSFSRVEDWTEAKSFRDEIIVLGKGGRFKGEGSVSGS